MRSILVFEISGILILSTGFVLSVVPLDIEDFVDEELVSRVILVLAETV
jgi:hypothetical protein